MIATGKLIEYEYLLPFKNYLVIIYMLFLIQRINKCLGESFSKMYVVM